jgi:hypothetical protein
VIRLALALAVLAGCTQDRDVLSQTLTACPADLAASAGEPCDFTESCIAAGSSACVTVTGSCTGGALHVDAGTSSCTPCSNDSACANGAALCGSGARCEACPPLDICATPDCPDGTAHLMRNGCAVCACAPAPACAVTSASGSGSANLSAACSGADQVCYRGEDCASGCLPSDPGCCTAECGAPGCTGPIPTGCEMPCGVTGAATCGSAATCIAAHCVCTAGSFECTPECADTSPGCSVSPTTNGSAD